MGKKGEGGVGRYGAGEVVGGGMVNGGEDDIVGLGYVLCSVRAAKRNRIGIGMKALTRPLLCSTQMAFFFWSTQSSPARTGVIVDGGTWRRPGPSFSVDDELIGTGSTSAGSSSPGRTSLDMVCVAIAPS